MYKLISLLLFSTSTKGYHSDYRLFSFYFILIVRFNSCTFSFLKIWYISHVELFQRCYSILGDWSVKIKRVRSVCLHLNRLKMNRSNLIHNHSH